MNVHTAVFVTSLAFVLAVTGDASAKCGVSVSANVSGGILTVTATPSSISTAPAGGPARTRSTRTRPPATRNIRTCVQKPARR